ncbi:MAG: cbb3-type cytochrome c oxidase subunit 3 [Bdellovibrionales bacterium]|jgi:cbb3-type cytochrome oxidase subunit 3|nr:cbb3-type cytochrome c oxidase subunit 3 [Bdellovibrionales bacterium]
MAMIDTFITFAPSIGLIGFFVAFVLIAVMTYLPSSKQRMEDHGNIPFKEHE